MKKAELEKYRKSLLLEHEHFLKMLYMAIIKAGVFDGNKYQLQINRFVLICTTARRMIVQIAGNENNPFVDVELTQNFEIERRKSYIVPGKWIVKAQIFIDNTLAESDAPDDLLDKMLHEDPEIEKIDLD